MLVDNVINVSSAVINSQRSHDLIIESTNCLVGSRGKFGRGDRPYYWIIVTRQFINFTGGNSVGFLTDSNGLNGQYFTNDNFFKYHCPGFFPLIGSLGLKKCLGEPSEGGNFAIPFRTSNVGGGYH